MNVKDTTFFKENSYLPGILRLLPYLTQHDLAFVADLIQRLLAVKEYFDFPSSSTVAPPTPPLSGPADAPRAGASQSAGKARGGVRNAKR